MSYQVRDKQTGGDPLVQEWVASLRLEGKSRETLKLYGWRIRHFLEGRDPLTVSAVDLKQYLGAIDRATTRNAARKPLKSFFGWLVEEGYRDDDPSLKLKRAREPTTRAEVA